MKLSTRSLLLSGTAAIALAGVRLEFTQRPLRVARSVERDDHRVRRVFPDLRVQHRREGPRD